MKKHLLFLIPAMIATSIQSSFSQNPYYFENIDINNINATISPSSDLFWDLNNPGFEVPIGSGKHSIFAGGLWIGGFDSGDTTIHLASQTYRQTGADFWPGPIDTTGVVGPANYLNYNKPWKVNKSEVLNHIQNWNTVNYVVPPHIADWPGFDTTIQRVLTPFADYNNNGIYDPENGDYPWILGDQSVYAVFNDWYPHTESNCQQYLGIEVHREIWGFDAVANSPRDNSIFSRYQVKNFSDNNYGFLYITIWTDFDIGNAVDDYVGTDIGLNMVYGYNGDVDDDTAVGYGLNPPACGVYFMNQNISGSMYYNNVNGSPTGNPLGCLDFYNYVNSTWLDNQPITYGGDGRNASNPITTFMFPGTTDSINYPTLGEWSEFTAGNTPEDRRIIGTIGPFELTAHGLITFDVGYTWAKADSGGPMASVAALQDAVESLRVMYNSGLLTKVENPAVASANTIAIYPNPASDLVTILNPKPEQSYSLTIQDAVGKIMLIKDNLKGEKFQFSAGHYSKGIYIVSVTIEGKTYNQKLLIK